MRQIINEKDIKDVIGRWVIQLNDKDEHIDITKTENPGFWLEKRISFVGCLYGVDGYPHIKPKKGEQYIILNGIYYCHGVKSHEEFPAFFNTCHPHYQEEGRGRFHRLMTRKELDWLNDQLKNRS